IIPEFAAKLGLNRNYVERARHFAREFSPEDVQKICEMCRRHNFPLGITLVFRVLRWEASERMISCGASSRNISSSPSSMRLSGAAGTCVPTEGALERCPPTRLMPAGRLLTDSRSAYGG